MGTLENLSTKGDDAVGKVGGWLESAGGWLRGKKGQPKDAPQQQPQQPASQPQAAPAVTPQAQPQAVPAPAEAPKVAAPAPSEAAKPAQSPAEKKAEAKAETVDVTKTEKGKLLRSVITTQVESIAKELEDVTGEANDRLIEGQKQAVLEALGKIKDEDLPENKDFIAEVKKWKESVLKIQEEKNEKLEDAKKKAQEGLNGLLKQIDAKEGSEAAAATTEEPKQSPQERKKDFTERLKKVGIPAAVAASVGGTLSMVGAFKEGSWLSWLVDLVSHPVDFFKKKFGMDGGKKTKTTPDTTNYALVKKGEVKVNGKDQTYTNENGVSIALKEGKIDTISLKGQKYTIPGGFLANRELTDGVFAREKDCDVLKFGNKSINLSRLAKAVGEDNNPKDEYTLEPGFLMFGMMDLNIEKAA